MGSAYLSLPHLPIGVEPRAQRRYCDAAGGMQVAEQSLEERANALADLIGDRLGVGGRGLETKLRRAGRLLPMRIRHEARLIVDALKYGSHPKLARQVDAQRLQLAFKHCRDWLEHIDRPARRRAAILDTAASIAFGLVAVFGLLLVVLFWRGYL